MWCNGAFYCTLCCFVFKHHRQFVARSSRNHTRHAWLNLMLLKLHRAYLDASQKENSPLLLSQLWREYSRKKMCTPDASDRIFSNFLGNPFSNALARFIVSRKSPRRPQKALKRLHLRYSAMHTRRSRNTCIPAVKFRFNVKHTSYKYFSGEHRHARNFLGMIINLLHVRISRGNEFFAPLFLQVLVRINRTSYKLEAVKIPPTRRIKLRGSEGNAIRTRINKGWSSNRVVKA